MNRIPRDLRNRGKTENKTLEEKKRRRDHNFLLYNNTNNKSIDTFILKLVPTTIFVIEKERQYGSKEKEKCIKEKEK